MVRNVTCKNATDLMQLLDGLCELQVRLIELVRTKMESMRDADVQKLRELCIAERALAKELQTRDGLRRELISAIGQEMGLSKTKAHGLTVSRIAASLPDSAGNQLLSVANRLGGFVAQAAQANRAAGTVSHELLNHLRWVFASVAPKDEQAAGYSGAGTPSGPSTNRLFDAFG